MGVFGDFFSSVAASFFLAATVKALSESIFRKFRSKGRVLRLASLKVSGEPGVMPGSGASSAEAPDQRKERIWCMEGEANVPLQTDAVPFFGSSLRGRDSRCAGCASG